MEEMPTVNPEERDMGPRKIEKLYEINRRRSALYAAIHLLEQHHVKAAEAQRDLDEAVKAYEVAIREHERMK